MRYSLHTTRARVAAGVLFAGLGVAVSLGLPAFGDEGGLSASDTEPQPEASRVADDGSVIPEPEDPVQPEDAIQSRDELVEIEKHLDPAESPAVYVCANEGAYEMRVVEGHEAPDDAKINPDAGPLKDFPDPCAGYDWVVGR